MDIQLSKPDQVDEIFKLLQDCGEHMRSQGIFQWNENYPLKSNVIADIENQSLYCYTDQNKVLGIVVIDENQSPEYADLPWKFNALPILVVHRFAVSPAAQGKGIGKKLMDFALDFAISNQYQSIRLDAYSGNARTLKFYKNRGYTKVGEIYFPYRTEHFDCFEKSLT